MDRLTLVVKSQLETVESLATFIRRHGFTLFDQECLAAPQEGRQFYRFSVAEGRLTIEDLVAELAVQSGVQSVRHERHSDLDSSILSRTTSIALAISGAYPDIVGLYLDFERSLNTRQRDLVIHDLGEKVGHLLIRHHFPDAKLSASLSEETLRIVLRAIQPFAIARISGNSLLVIACPFCREVESLTAHCGFLAGLFQALVQGMTGQRVEVEEVECRARGDQVCRFDFSTPSSGTELGSGTELS